MASADGNTPPPTSAMDTTPSMCAKGCGFFGNANTGGMCSKCYKETLAKSAAQAPAPAVAASTPAAAAPAVPAASFATPAAPVSPAAAAVPSPPTAAATTPAPPAPAPSASKAEASSPAAAVVSVTTAARMESDEPTEEPPKKKQVNTNRCWTCNKKIGLLGFQCKCDYYFCSEHRYSDKHECAFDFKALGKQQLAKANPTIAPSKLEAM